MRFVVRTGKSEPRFRTSKLTVERRLAYKPVRDAVDRGELLPQPCEICKKEPSHAHHDDYSKPLNVRWLCPLHHSQYHQSIIANNTLTNRSYRQQD